MSFLAPFAGAIGLAGTAMQVVGSLTSANANANAASYNAGVATQNAQIADQQGAAAVVQQGRYAARSMGRAVAGYGASGVSLDTGSPLDVLADAAGQAELDALTTKYNYQLKALSYRNQATLNDQQASNYRTSGVLNALGYGFKGAGQAIPLFGSGGKLSDPTDIPMQPGGGY